MRIIAGGRRVVFDASVKGNQDFSDKKLRRFLEEMNSLSIPFTATFPDAHCRLRCCRQVKVYNVEDWSQRLLDEMASSGAKVENRINVKRKLN